MPMSDCLYDMGESSVLDVTFISMRGWRSISHVGGSILMMEIVGPGKVGGYNLYAQCWSYYIESTLLSDRHNNCSLLL